MRARKCEETSPPLQKFNFLPPGGEIPTGKANDSGCMGACVLKRNRMRQGLRGLGVVLLPKVGPNLTDRQENNSFLMAIQGRDALPEARFLPRQRPNIYLSPAPKKRVLTSSRRKEIFQLINHLFFLQNLGSFWLSYDEENPSLESTRIGPKMFFPGCLSTLQASAS